MLLLGLPSQNNLKPDLEKRNWPQSLRKRAGTQHKHSFSYYKDIYLIYENNVQ